jgi:hypothetical protein
MPLDGPLRGACVQETRGAAGGRLETGFSASFLQGYLPLETGWRLVR